MDYIKLVTAFFTAVFINSSVLNEVVLPDFNLYPKHTSVDENDPFLIKKFKLSGAGNLIVKTSGGAITVVGQQGNDVKVEMYVKKGKGGFFSIGSSIEKALEDYTITIEQDGNTIRAIAEAHNDGGWFTEKPSISFKVYIPHHVSSDLKTSGGSIQVSDLDGEQKIRTSGGSIKCSAIRGNTEAKTSGGSIRIESYEGKLDATTSGGSIQVKKGSGKLRVHTSGGSISLDEVAGAIDASTSGGSIKANIVELEEYLILSTSGGSIHANIPSRKGLDLDLKGSSVITQLQNFEGRKEKDHIIGTMHGGGTVVKMKTSGGNVNLAFAK